MPLTVVQDTLPVFPTDLAFEHPGGPEYNTDVQILESGHEQRNSFWPEPKYSWDVGYGVKTFDKVYALLEFFHACRGRAKPFRFKDWADYKSSAVTGAVNFTDQSLGVATAGQTQFQLIKTYAKSPYETVLDIIKPKGSTVRVGVNGVEETTGWTVSEVTGLITRSVALAGGETVTWGGEFYRKARFDVDKIPVQFHAWEVGSIEVPVISLRGT
jgi:uncharacterized protein (TIGR02217 family)